MSDTNGHDTIAGDYVPPIAGIDRTMELRTPRTWRERLFSRPWRPWYDERVMVFRAMIVGVDTNDDGGCEISFELTGGGPIADKIVRSGAWFGRVRALVERLRATIGGSR